MNIYIYPEEMVAITGAPETNHEATSILPGYVTPPRISIELERGTVELVLTHALAWQLANALEKAYPGNPQANTASDEEFSRAARYADEHAAEFETKA